MLYLQKPACLEINGGQSQQLTTHFTPYLPVSMPFPKMWKLIVKTGVCKISDLIYTQGILECSIASK